jgi:S1-C subfamily serine protease
MTRTKFLIPLLLLVSLLISCAFNTQVNKKLMTAKKSFIRVDAMLIDEECARASCIMPQSIIPYATASGAIVQIKNKYFILTAAHVCNSNNQIIGQKEVHGHEVKFVLVDRDNKEFEGKVAKVDFNSDICLLYSEEITGPPLKLAGKRPEYADKIYNIASPLGISHKEMVLLFEGHYSANVDLRAYYTIPTTQGSSGSPILNSNGELVGMIHSVHARFHHIAVSPTYTTLWNFLH